VTYSFLSHLEGSRCTKQYDCTEPQSLRECGGPLLARYDLGSAAKPACPDTFSDRDWSMWRYHELPSVRSPADAISLNERVTPLIALLRLGNVIRLPHLAMKDEGILPMGTFKARGAAVGISRAY